MTSANELLMGSGGASASFPTIGTTVSGQIVSEPKVQQQIDPATKEGKVWKNGDPMMQIVVALQTTERNPQRDGDDGIRNLYVKGAMLKTVREAVAQTGARGLEVGGTLTVTYVADGEKTNPAFAPPKLYTAQYRPPAGAAANAMLMGQPAAAPAPYQQPPAAPAAYSAITTAIGSELQNAGPPAGIDPTFWSTLPPAQQQAILAAAAR